MASGRLADRHRQRDRGITEARVVGDFISYPIGQIESLIYRPQFHFGLDQAVSATGEHVDFPDLAVMRHPIAGFFDDRPRTKPLKHLFRLIQWNFIFELIAHHATARGFEGKPRLVGR